MRYVRGSYCRPTIVVIVAGLLVGSAVFVGMGSSAITEQTTTASAERAPESPARIDGEPGKWHTITIVGQGSRADYSFEVTGDLEAGDGVGSGDRIDGSRAEGFVRGGTDTYRYTGEVHDLAVDGAAVVDITNGTWIGGPIGADGVDRYEFTADAGQAIRVIHGPADAGVNLTLSGPTGEVLAEDTTIDGDVTAFGARATDSGTYTLDATGDFQHYGIQVETADPNHVDPYANTANDDRESALAIDTDDQLTGVLAAGEQDWFAVDLAEGDRLTVTLQHEGGPDVELGNGMQVDILDADGGAVGEFGREEARTSDYHFVDGYEEATQTAVADSAGTYYVRIRGYGTGILGFTEYELAVGSDPGERDTDGEWHTLTIDGQNTGSRTDYTVEVSGELEAVEGIGSGDSIDGSTAEGSARGGTDVYRFTGTLENFTLDGGDAVLTVDGDRRGTADEEAQNDDGGDTEWHTLTIDGQDTGSRTDYSVTVSGELEAKAGIGTGDSIRGSTAEGFTRGGDDVYRFTGTLEDYDLSGGDAVLTVDGERVDEASGDSSDDE